MDLSKYKAKPDKTIREHTDDLMSRAESLYNMKYIREDKLYGLLKQACEYHDYGKSNKEFQKRILNKTKFNPETEIAHNVLSLFFIDRVEFESIEDYYIVANAVLEHHDYCSNIDVARNLEYAELRNTLLKDFLTYTYKVSKRDFNKLIDIREKQEAIMVKGLLNKCDYAASAERCIEYKNEFMKNGLANLLSKWQKVKKESKWNALQRFCMKNTEKNIIAVAQTGMGKTEAGLHWIGNNKGFFILPLKTAINAIYKRVKNEILDNTEIENKLGLLHGDAMSYFIQHNENNIDTMDYYSKSKNMSLPLNIATLDQLFYFVFKYPGYEINIATLSYSKVVIDEIQMYGPDLLAYLIYGLIKIDEFGGKIAILTATFAPFIRDLLKTYSRGKLEFEEGIFINEVCRHNISVYNHKIESDIIYNQYLENEKLNISNKILVVCNTVKKAQCIYKELKVKGIKNINILHSKFIKKERSYKEDKILEFGKTYIDGGTEINVDTGIWVSTQLVEASLDIDFDYLFTELSDINGLLQRLGRCNRKGVKNIESPNCFVFSEIDKTIIRRGNNGFIDKTIYELSKEALIEMQGIVSEEKKIDIVNKYMTTEKIKDSDFIRDVRGYYEYINDLYIYEKEKKDVSKEFRNILSYNVIPKMIYDENKIEITKNLLKLESDTILVEDKIKIIDQVRAYTVPVGHYDIYFKSQNAISETIELNKWDKLFILNCTYSEIGFEKIQKVSQEKEEIFDNFI